MIYHLFQNSVWKVVKIAKTSNLKSAVKSQSITTVLWRIWFALIQRRDGFLEPLYNQDLMFKFWVNFVFPWKNGRVLLFSSFWVNTVGSHIDSLNFARFVLLRRNRRKIATDKIWAPSKTLFHKKIVKF